MTRFAWLQMRTQAFVAFGALAIVGIVLAVTGPHLVHLFNANVAHCAAHNSCDPAKAAFLRNDKTLRTWLNILVIVVPGIIGLFWGAPLVARELETGTHRLAWTQSVSRTRWLAAKLGTGALLAMIVTGLFSLMVTWWSSPFDIVNADRFSSPNFDSRGIVAIGYVAFAFALGVTAGVLIRRTLPAMATTLVAFVAVRIGTAHWLRPHLMAPAHRLMSLQQSVHGFGSTNSGSANLIAFPPDLPNAWVTSTRIVDQNGHALTPQRLAALCPRLATDLGAPRPGPGAVTRAKVPGNAKDEFSRCISKVATQYHAVVSYQPAGRYWAFQWLELAIFLGAAVALCGLCVWQVRRRRA